MEWAPYQAEAASTRRERVVLQGRGAVVGVHHVAGLAVHVRHPGRKLACAEIRSELISGSASLTVCNADDCRLRGSGFVEVHKYILAMGPSEHHLHPGI